jgi:hypothetical protein
MSTFNVEAFRTENQRRIREVIMAGPDNTDLEFSKHTVDFTAVFEPPLKKFQAGRVTLLQQTLGDALGVPAEIVKATNASEISFALALPSKENSELLYEFFKSTRSHALYDGVRITKIECRGEKFTPRVQPN